MKKLICLLFGHKYTFVDDDMGICSICRKEFALDLYSYESGFLRKNPPALIDILEYLTYKVYSSCPYCSKVKYILGLHLVRSHSKCAPF